MWGNLVDIPERGRTFFRSGDRREFHCFRVREQAKTGYLRVFRIPALKANQTSFLSEKDLQEIEPVNSVILPLKCSICPVMSRAGDHAIPRVTSD